jgi:hypothetical protein
MRSTVVLRSATFSATLNLSGLQLLMQLTFSLQQT